MDLTPFPIAIPDSDLRDLQDRLARTRWAPPAAVTGWERGVPVDYLRELAAYWREGFDWRRQEERLNALAHLRTVIDGQPIHAVHVRSPVRDALPLVLTHGWPGTFAEFLEVVGPLSDPAAHGGDPRDAFHLVIPSLPGSAFSSPLYDRGWDTPRIARAWAELMERLGYRRYGAQGGDTGSLVAPELGRIAPDRVVGVHVNGPLVMPTGVPGELDDLDGEERRRLAVMDHWNRELSGYGALQATRPQTLAHALTDSPAGQLAWIVERFHDWTDPAAALPEDAVDRDLLLTNVALTWLTRTAASSASLYADGADERRAPKRPSGVPTAVAVFPMDRSIRRLVEREHRVVRWTVFDRGGHFAAMEAPDLLVGDIRAFFADLRDGA